MKLLIDKTVPFINGVFEPYCDVAYSEFASLSGRDLSDVDGIIVRSRVKCDASLLEGSGIKIIATANIGTDNIDIKYCSDNGIFVRNAAGCNAGAVMNYVFSALYGTAARKSINLQGATIGIVGVGNTGGRIEKTARALGFKVLLCDPPRAEKEGMTQFCTLDYLLENSDIVTLHLPLNESTKGIANADFFSRMRMGAFFINTSRGETVVDEDLMLAIPKLGAVVIDTWNKEPDIDRRLLDLVDIATPHIAGFSYQGKLLATREAVRSIARYFGISELYEFFPKPDIQGLDAVRIDPLDKTQGQLAAIFQYNYPVFTDDFIFRMNPDGFEDIRSNYRYRREFFVE